MRCETCKILIDLLLLIDGELSGAHVDEEEETATVKLLELDNVR